MKRYILLMISFLLFASNLAAQGEENIWTFGLYNYSIDFNTIPPVVSDISNNPNYRLPAGVSNQQSIVVCDAAGNRLFTVRKSIDLQNSIPDIYDRFDNPIPGTNLLTSAGLNYREQTPTVVPHPGNPHQYYIFYGRNGGLLYTLFDMSLNNGLGNAVPGQHNILIAGYSTVACEAMTAIKGCNAVWLLVRKQKQPGFLSFRIDRNGLHLVPISSTSGMIQPEYFELIRNMKASPDGCRIAVSFATTFNIPLNYRVPGGLVIYDFEPCSGQLVNERILDWNNNIEGLCFSPDNSKLYATQNDTAYVLASQVYHTGKVFQYDFSLPNWNDIRSSKTLILENPEAYLNDMFCPTVYCRLGDMKTGPDGKIYLLNNHPGVCFGTSLAFHIIHQPNNVGLASLPEINALYNTMNGMVNIASHNPDLIFLPRDIVSAPNTSQDTFTGSVNRISFCFKEDKVLSAPENKSCYIWNTGSTEKQITVGGAGTYWVSYFEDCRIMIDTYYVKFVSLPEINSLYYGCDGDISFRITDENEYEYELFKDNGRNKVTSAKGNEFTVNGLEAGEYSLRIRATPECDTVINIILAAYPKPGITVSPKDTTIQYGESIALHAKGAKLYTWWPSNSLDTSMGPTPQARPMENTRYIVTGINDYGCHDTAHILVDINQTRPLVPNAFTPNGDGLNDVFRIEGITAREIRSFEIYNRFGEMVHAEYHSNNGWDGTYRGNPCDAGTYFYIIETDNINGSSQRFKGDVHLLR